MLRRKSKHSFDEFAKVAKPLGKEEMKTYVGGVMAQYNPNFIPAMKVMDDPVPDNSCGSGGRGSRDITYIDPMYGSYHSDKTIVYGEPYVDGMMPSDTPNGKYHSSMADNLLFYDGLEEAPYNGGWSDSNENLDDSMLMEEVVVVGHRPKRSYSDLIYNYGYMGKFSDHMDFSYGDSYNNVHGGSDITSKGSGGSASTLLSLSRYANDKEHANLYDGIDLANNKYIALDLKEYVTLSKQIKEILRSNATLKELLRRFDKGLDSFTIGVRNFNDGGKTFGETTLFIDGTIKIELNTEHITETGWEDTYMGEDNIGYSHSVGYTQEEKLLITFVHEAIHANHESIYADALRANGSDTNDAANWLLGNGYSSEFVNIFFKKQDGVWVKRMESREDNLHTYMKKYDLPVIDAALREYREDHSYRK